MRKPLVNIFSFAIDVMYFVLLVLTLPFVITRVKRAGYRLNRVAPPCNDCIIFRAASVGEVTLIKPLVDNLSKDYKVVVAVNTQAAVERADKLYGENASVVFAPIDFSFMTRRFYARFTPRLVVMVEQEIWPNFVMNSPAPLVLVNARMGPGTVSAYKMLRPFVAAWFRRFFARIYCSNKLTHVLFASMLGDRAVHYGNLKLDAVELPGDRVVKDERVSVVLANTHEGEERDILRCVREASGGGADIRVFVAPRHVERAGSVASLVESMGYRCSLYSSGVASDAVIVDKIGVMNDIYRKAHIAVIGGSFVDKGGHNFMEPAAFSCAMVLGPYFHNFRDEALYFMNRNAILSARNFEGLKMHLKRLLTDRENVSNLGRLAREALADSQGVSSHILSDLRRIIVKEGK